MMLRHRSAGVRLKVAAICRAEAMTLAWRKGTIFGRDVVPDVCSSSARSASAAAPGLAAAWHPSRKAGAKLPAPAARKGSSSINRDSTVPRHLPDRMIFAGFDDDGIDLEIGQVEVQLIGAIGRIERAVCAPAAIARNAAAISARSATEWRSAGRAPSHEH